MFAPDIGIWANSIFVSTYFLPMVNECLLWRRHPSAPSLNKECSMEFGQLKRRRNHDPVQTLNVDCQRANEERVKNA